MSTDLLSVLLSPPALALLGLCIGSFLNVVVHRKPQLLEREWLRDMISEVTVSPSPRLTAR